MNDDRILSVFRPQRRAEIVGMLRILMPADLVITRAGWNERAVETAVSLADSIMDHGAGQLSGGDDGEGMMRFVHDVLKDDVEGRLIVSGLPNEASVLVGRATAHLVRCWAALAPEPGSPDPDGVRINAIAAMLRDREIRSGRGAPEQIRIARPGPERPWRVSFRRGTSFDPPEEMDDDVRKLLDGLRPTVCFAMLLDTNLVQVGRHVDVVGSDVDPIEHIRALAAAAGLLGDHP